MLYLRELTPEIDQLQSIHGDPSLSAIYGAGKISCPDILLMFMNPTGRNISSQPGWTGIKAPWLGTKGVWQMLYDLELLSKQTLLEQIEEMKPIDWNEEFSEDLYHHVSESSIYITNIAKCTQLDARKLPNSIFKEYLDNTFQEIDLINPKVIISFGNQVSSVFLGKNISVSDYLNNYEEFEIGGSSYKVFPCYYPVGQGQRNMPIAKKRIKQVMQVC